MLRYGGERVIEWLTRVRVVCLAEGKVPVEFKRVIVFFPYVKVRVIKMSAIFIGK